MIGPETDPEKAEYEMTIDRNLRISVSALEVASDRLARLAYRQMTFQKFFWTDVTPSYLPFLRLSGLC